MIAERAAISHTAAGAASVQFVPTPMAGYSSLMGFHRHLLEDTVRTGTFIRAIQQVVRQDDTVVDLGAGTGILTMACLRAGAQKVYAIEADQLIVLAEQAARANAMADRIVFMNRHSSDVTLPEKADVIVSECLGLMGIGGSMIPAVVDMRRRGPAPTKISQFSSARRRRSSSSCGSMSSAAPGFGRKGTRGP